MNHRNNSFVWYEMKSHIWNQIWDHTMGMFNMKRGWKYTLKWGVYRPFGGQASCWSQRQQWARLKTSQYPIGIDYAVQILFSKNTKQYCTVRRAHLASKSLESPGKSRSRMKSLRARTWSLYFWPRVEQRKWILAKKTTKKTKTKTESPQKQIDRKNHQNKQQKTRKNKKKQNLHVPQFFVFYYFLMFFLFFSCFFLDLVF